MGELQNWLFYFIIIRKAEWVDGEDYARAKEKERPGVLALLQG